jgi:Tfp pilus assembly protein PilF
LSILAAGITFLIVLTATTAAAQPTVSILGQLYTPTGTPAATYTIELSNPTANLPIERTSSNTDGKFEFHNIKAGSYTIFVKTDRGDVVGLSEVTGAIGSSPVHIQVLEPPQHKPVTGTVSAITLRHRPPKKAVQEMNAALKASAAGKTDLVQGHLQAALRIDPDFSEAHTNLGAIYTRANKLDLAYTEFQEAFRTGPHGAMQYCNIAVVALALNRPEEAEREVRQALAIESRNPQSNFLLGKILATRPNGYDEAVMHLKLATSDIANAHVLLAELYARSGHKREAIAALQNYEQVNPSANREKVEKMILSLR